MTGVMRSHCFTLHSVRSAASYPSNLVQLRVERDHSILAILVQTQCSQAKAQS